MGTFYRDKTREFNNKCLVLCEYLYWFKGEQCHDVIMISVDCSRDILSEFAKHCKILERKNPKLICYLPECGTSTFDYRVKHGS